MWVCSLRLKETRMINHSNIFYQHQDHHGKPTYPPDSLLATLFSQASRPFVPHTPAVTLLSSEPPHSVSDLHQPPAYTTGLAFSTRSRRAEYRAVAMVISFPTVLSVVHNQHAGVGTQSSVREIDRLRREFSISERERTQAGLGIATGDKQLALLTGYLRDKWTHLRVPVSRWKSSDDRRAFYWLPVDRCRRPPPPTISAAVDSCP